MPEVIMLGGAVQRSSGGVLAKPALEQIKNYLRSGVSSEVVQCR